MILSLKSHWHTRVVNICTDSDTVTFAEPEREPGPSERGRETGRGRETLRLTHGGGGRECLSETVARLGDSERLGERPVCV